MKIALIKQLNEKTPYWVKRPFAPVIRRKLIANPTFVKQYEALLKEDSMSEEDMRAEQLCLLQQTLRHAYDHTGYYRKLFDHRSMRPEDIHSVADLSGLPILTKKDLEEHFAELQADDISDSYEVSTGGTTGKPTHVLMERDAIYREWAFIYHYWSKFGYDYRSSKLATLRGVNLGKRLYEINPLYQEIRLNLFLMNRDNIRQYVQVAEKYGADFLYGYPSSVYNFCRLAREAGIGLRGKFKAALLISENLYPFQEEEITGTLGCPIAIFYGHSERAVFAERYGNGYVFQPLYGVTEISPDHSPIVTGFINRKMPLIRYEVDDRVEQIEDNVDIVGHWNAEMLYGRNGERISIAAINFHDGTFAGVDRYQFVQDQAGECILKVVPGSEAFSEKDVERIVRNVNRKLGTALKCSVERVQQIEITTRGKYKMVVQNYRGGALNPIDSPAANGRFYKIIGHREEAVLYGSRGEHISVAAINFHDATFDDVESYQFVQREPGKCVLNIVFADRSRADVARIARNVNGKLGDGIRCEIQVVPEIPLTSRGKYRMIVQQTTLGGGKPQT